MGKIVDFTEAEKNAKVRDLEIEKKKFEQEHNGVSKDDLEKAMELISKATGKEHYIGTKRSPQSRVKFVQLIQDNWDYAIENKRLDDEEILFLMRIQRKLAFKSNCIVFDIHAKEQIPMTQKDIADFLGVDKSRVSKLVKKLMDKGIIVRAMGHKKEGVNARAYSLYINPNLMFCGDKSNVEETLKTMFINAKEKTKDFPIQLF